MYLYFLIILICCISIISFSNSDFFYKLSLKPYRVFNNDEWYRIITSCLLHADILHLVFNLYALFSFGTFVEDSFTFHFGKLGGLYMVIFFVFSHVVSEISSLIKNRNNIYYTSIGASGGISAFILFFVLNQPLSVVYFFFIPMPSFVMGFLFLSYSYFISKKQLDNVNHEAHFYGSLFGIFVAFLLDTSIFNTFICNFF